MKYLNKILLWAVTAIAMLWFWLSETQAATLTQMWSKEQSCPWALVSNIYYIPNGQTEVRKFKWDMLWANKEVAISNSRTVVKYWDPAGLLSECTSVSSWVARSGFAPANTPVLALWANCTIKKPTNKNNRHLQIVYNVWHGDIVSWWGMNLTTHYYWSTSDYFAWNKVMKTFTNVGLANKWVHANECDNMEIRYCGDWLVTNGEQCDPEAPGSSAATCDVNTCMPITQPACTGISVTTDGTLEPVTAQVTCTGVKSATFKVDCGNGHITSPKAGTYTGGANQEATATFECQYNAWNTSYYPTCYANNTITSNACNSESTAVSVPVSPRTPEITVLKLDYNTYDLDGEKGAFKNLKEETRDNGQKVKVWDDATFRIRVSNTWNEDLKDIKLVDAKAWACATNDGTFVNLWGKTFNNKVGGSTNIMFGWAWNHNDNILQQGEFFEYDCTQPNTPGEYTNEVKASGTWNSTDKPTNVSSDTTKVYIASFDLALIKTNPEKGREYKKWDTVTFNITVQNQWAANANGITIIDYIPEGLTPISNNPGWTVSGNTMTYVLWSLNESSTSSAIPVKFTIDEDAPASITNVAEISEADGVDIDSTPDTNEGNDCHTSSMDNSFGGWGKGDNNVCDAWEDEDDSDPETIVVTEDNYDLELIKKVKGTKTQFKKSEDVTFTITVNNAGDEATQPNTIEITDHIPTGLILNDSKWNESAGKATYMIPVSISTDVPYNVDITFTVDTATAGKITNWAEISKDGGEDCDSTPGSDNDPKGEVDNDNKNSSNQCKEDWDEDDHDPADITILEPGVYDLALVKTHSADYEDKWGTKLVEKGDIVTFYIDVFNQWEMDANEIEIIDYIPDGLELVSGWGWTATTVNGKPAATLTIDSLKIGKHYLGTIRMRVTKNLKELWEPKDWEEKGLITNIFEIFNSKEIEDWIVDVDSTPDQNPDNDCYLINNYTEGDAKSWSCVDNVYDEDDHDKEFLKLKSYDLALKKTLKAWEAETASKGWDVTFTITVKNQGTVPSGNITITDYIPVGLTLSDPDWSEVGNKATFDMTSIEEGQISTVDITFSVDEDAPAEITNWAEISSDNGDDIDSNPDSNKENDCYHPSMNDSLDGEGVANAEWICDEDDHDPETIQVGSFDLALKKTINDAKDSYKTGDTVEFEIYVENQGTIEAKTVVITDYIPAGLQLDDSSWAINGWKAVKIIDTLAPKGQAWDSTTLTITFEITATANTGIENIAEISAANGHDCDSTPDNNKDNDELINDEIGSWCEKGWDEDDHDHAIIENVNPDEDYACAELIATPTDLKTGETSEFICKATDATEDNYRLVLEKEGEEPIWVPLTLGSDQAEGSYTFTQTGSYTATCYVADETTQEELKCIKPIEVTQWDTWPKISIEKFETGWTEWVDELQKVDLWAKAQFTIIVRNTGTEALKDVVVTDLRDDVVCPTAEMTIWNLAVWASSNPILCEWPATTGDYRNTAKVDGKWETSDTPVTDQNSTDVKVILVEWPKILIEKFETGWTEWVDELQKVNAWDKAKFTIIVRNIGTEALKDVVVIDLRDDVVCPVAEMTIWNLAVGATRAILCEWPATTADYRNTAKVDGKWETSDTPVTDQNSTDVEVIGLPVPSISIEKFETGWAEWVNELQKVDSWAKAKFTIIVKNTWGVALENVQVTDLYPGVTCPAADMAVWNLAVWASSNLILCEWPATTGNYRNTAEVKGDPVWGWSPVTDSNFTDVEMQNGPTDPPWGWWLSCEALTKIAERDKTASDGTVIWKEVDFECYWFKDHTQVIDCNGNGVYDTWIDKIQINDAWTISHTCEYTTDWNYNATCYVSRAQNGWEDLTKWYKTDLSCKKKITYGAPTPVCGNGVREDHPTDSNLDEECDGWTSCTSCKIDDTSTRVDTCENSRSYVEENPAECLKCEDDTYYANNPAECQTKTYPSGWEMEIWIGWSAYFGENMEAFRLYNADGTPQSAYRPVYIRNVWDSNIQIDKKLCVYNQDSSTGVVWTEWKVCSNTLIGELEPYSISWTEIIIQDTELAKFKWDVTHIWNQRMWETDLRITLDWYNWDVYFSEVMKARVYNPWTETSSWDAYIAKSTSEKMARKEEIKAHVKLDDSEALVVDGQDETFGWTIVTDDTTDWNAVTDSTIVQGAVDDWTEYEGGASNIVNGWAAATTVAGVGTFASYQWNDNVRYIENANVTLGATDFTGTLSEPTTYYVKGWSLTITWNIASDKNIAFIVDGWNLNIDKNVTELEWIYWVAWIGDRITANATTTTNQLNVNGKLYGNIDQLNAWRTFVYYDELNGTISLWTVIKFGRDLFMDPAPMVAKLMQDWSDLDATHVAQ